MTTPTSITFTNEENDITFNVSNISGTDGGSGEENCPDSAITPIILFDKRVYRRCEVCFTLDDGTNYVDYVFRVAYDGSGAMDNGGDAFVIAGSTISGLSVSSSISGHYIILAINNASGNAVKCVYKITDRLALST